MNDLIKINYKHDYVFLVEFDNGVCGEIDFAEYVNKGPMFEAFNDIQFFKSAVIEGGAIAWLNGADIAPERLYEMEEYASLGVPRSLGSSTLRHSTNQLSLNMYCSLDERTADFKVIVA